MTSGSRGRVITVTPKQRGRCVGCRRVLTGPGDRCPPCQAELKARRKRRRR